LHNYWTLTRPFLLSETKICVRRAILDLDPR
jgi:hypothetical protein